MARITIVVLTATANKTTLNQRQGDRNANGKTSSRERLARHRSTLYTGCMAVMVELTERVLMGTPQDSHRGLTLTHPH